MMMFIQFIFVSLLTTQVFSDGLNSRITNSYMASKGQFPHQVELSRSNVWGVPDQLEQRAYCGGSIINESWVLTAAYCVYGIPSTLSSQIKVLAGAHDLTETTESDRQSRYVSSIHIHSSYPGLNAQHDIALLKLNEPLVFDGYVKAISLSNSNASYSGDAQISGWGSTSTTDSFSMPGTLRYETVVIASYDACKNTMKQMGAHLEIFNTQLCTGTSLSTSISTCIGDSGSPLIQQNSGTWEQVGIVSWGLYPCGISKISSVYTRVSHYVGWINEIMSIN
ncbi:trypsin-1-like [Aphidius gifuensis]|uniref:trypsin-1-like n=1 Tax=Aphidius gifuensis TaxID=684658 RepID=UPI001CDD4BD7|nr:trypsin-1-like [Aphidius gifuensis]